MKYLTCQRLMIVINFDDTTTELIGEHFEKICFSQFELKYIDELNFRVYLNLNWCKGGVITNIPLEIIKNWLSDLENINTNKVELMYENLELNITFLEIDRYIVSGVLLENMMSDSKINFEFETKFYRVQNFISSLKIILDNFKINT